MLKFRKIMLLSSVAAAITGAAQAQEAGGDTRLEEIVVTAQRRSQNLQDVPLAVSAVTAATAARMGVTDPVSVSQIVPGFQLNRAGNVSTPFIRGVGTNSGFIGNEPSVASFVDDLYTPSTASSVFEFNNIDSIEVLKGPQGTLFGRNATGGVLHIRTRTPTHTPTMDVAASYGNYDTKVGQFYGSAGLTDTIAANVALYGSKQSDGWGRNIVTGRETYLQEGFGARGKVLIEPTAEDSILLMASYDFRKSSQGIAQRVVPNVFSVSGYSPDRAGAGFYDVTSNMDGPYKTNFFQMGAKVRHDFENASLVSISGFSRLRSKAHIDTDTTPVAQVNIWTDAQERTFTQELQLLSSEASDIQWILGAYYLFDKTRFRAMYFGSAFGALTQNPDTFQTTDSISGFAQATAEVLPRTRMTIGVRYTADKRRFDGSVTFGPTLRGPFHHDKSFSNLTGRFALDYRFTDNVMGYASYNRGFKSGVYNLPALTVASTAAPVPVEPEDLNAYAVGFKTEFWDNRLRLNGEAYLYEHKNVQVVSQVVGTQILTNAGAARIKGFDLDLTLLPVENLTLTAAVSIADGHYTRFPAGPTFFPFAPNAPLAKRPPGCVLASGVPLPENVYPTAPNAAAPSIQVACDLKGKKTVQTVPFSANVSATYRVPTGFGPFDLAVSWAHGGGFYWEASNNRESYQHKQDIINASIQWSAPGEAFSVRLWGRNLGQEKYYAYAANSAASGQKYAPAAPRTYGVTLAAHY